MRQRTAARLAWGGVGLSVAMVAACGFLWVLNRSTTVPVDFGTRAAVVILAFASLPFAGVGALIISRRSLNNVGWICLVIGLLAAGFHLAGEYAAYALLTAPNSLPGGDVAAWLFNWLWVVYVALIGVYLILIFPEGHLYSREWRLVPWVGGVGTLLGVIYYALAPGPLQSASYATNPFGLRSGGEALELLSLGFFVVALCILASTASMIVRFRRAKGEERQQLKWFASAAALSASAFFGQLIFSFVTGSLDDPSAATRVLQNAAVLSFYALPLATGIAILKYRLYDIDVVINKTLVFGGLAAFITVVYVGVVVGIGTALGNTGGSRLELSIAATAIVAVAFQPVRERVQRWANRLVYGERATPYEVMSDFTHSVAAVLSVDDVLPRMAEAAAAGLGAARTKVSVSLENGLSRSVVWPEDAEGGFDTSLDIAHRGEKVGEIAIAKPPGEPLRPAEKALLNDLASQAGIALHNARLALQLQARLDEISIQANDLAKSRERVVSAADTSRRRIERAIRSGPERRLQKMGADLDKAGSVLDRDPNVSVNLLTALQSEANATLQMLRDLARGIYPPLLADKGLVSALETYVRRSEAVVELRFPPGLDDKRFDQAIESAVYFCTLEALDNVETHAPQARAVVSLEASERDLMFRVEDDGPGFDAERTARGTGHYGMVDRVEALGGSLGIESAPGNGTVVTGRLPARPLDRVS